MVTQRTRDAYRQLLKKHGAADLPDELVDKYIRIQRIRLAIYLPICAVILGWVVYIWVR